MPLITLTTDFTPSIAAGIMKAVIKRICPAAEILELTHQVPAFDVEAGAIYLRDALPYLPVAIHVAVVDPGVGSARRPVAVQAARGDVFVAPDNGLISLALERAGGATAAHVIENPQVILQPCSHTFHGRDIFAPAAAHLAAGMPLSALGPAVDPATLARIHIPPAAREGEAVAGLLLRYDPFGTACTNIAAADLAPLGLRPGDPVEVEAGGLRLIMPFVRTYSDVPPGEWCCLVDSSGYLEVAVNRGSARERLGLAPRTPLRLRRRAGTPA